MIFGILKYNYKGTATNIYKISISDTFELP